MHPATSVSRLLLLAAVLLAPCEAAGQTAPDAIDRLVGQRVASVTLEIAGQPEAPTALKSAIDVKADQPLRLEDVHSSVHHLYSAGYIAQVFGTLVAGGVDVVFRLTPIHPVADFAFKGDTGLTPGELRRLALQRFGESPATTSRSALADFVKETLAGAGYLRAAPTVAAEETETPPRTTLVVTVNAGPQARIGQVKVEGTLGPLSKDDVLHPAGAESGAPYRPRAIDAGLAKVRDKLRADGRYAATAVAEPPEVSADGATVNLTLAVDAGPRVVLTFRGEKPPGNIDDLVPIQREGSADRDLLDDSKQRLEAAWHELGYKNAHAEYTSVLQGDRLDITFTISRGQRYVIGDVQVSGNAAFSADQIKKTLGLTIDAPLVVSRIVVAAYGLRLAYTQLGYYTAAVTYAEEETGDTKAPEVRDVIHVQVTEGPRGTVKAIVFHRATQGIRDADLRAAMRSKIDGPFAPQNLRDDEDMLKTLYADRGFPLAEVSESPGGTETDKTLTVDITEGPQIIVGDIRVVGNRKTSEDAIRRALTLAVGQPFGEAARRDSEQRVMRFGLFRSVQITAEPMAPGDTRAHIVVTVEEAPATVVGYGGGVEAGQRNRPTDTFGVQTFSYVAPRGFFEITRQNFGGVNRSIDVFSRVSLSPSTSGSGYGFTEYRVAGTYKDHLIFDTDTDLTSTVSSEQGIRTDFSFIRKAVNVVFDHRASRRVRFSGRYTLEFTKLLDESIAPSDLPLIDRQFPAVRLSVVSGSAIWDRRNDAVAPSRGSLLSADVDLAPRDIGSEQGFAKTLLQASAFHSLTGGKGIIGAVRAEFGLAHGFPRSVVTTGPDGLPVTQVVTDLPASERFFAGGGTTVRGFSLDSLGVPSIIDSNGLSLGGNGLVILNAELRMTVAKIFRHDFGVVTFADGGNVFAKAADINLREIRGALGFGVRYDSPLGPIRLDFGFKLNRLVVGGALESAWSWHLSIGEAF